MLNRWGEHICVGWLPHEILWVEAAITLKTEARLNAFRDIADMRCCLVETVQKKATEVRNRIRQERAAADQRAVFDRRPILAARATSLPPRLMPSDLKQPTQAQLTGTRA